MKKIYLAIILICSLQLGFGQIGFEDHIISNELYEAGGAKMALIADIDGDGDMDIVSAASTNNAIAIHENIDGLGTFKFRFLSLTVDGIQAIEVADLDGDGDMDVAAISSSNDSLIWFKNTDGNGNFSAKIILDDTINYPIDVKAADLDGDGDNDLIVGGAGDDKIGWYENTNGQGIFDSIQDITVLTDNIYSFAIADIDGDGDKDILSASRNDNKIAWYENTDGLGNYGPQQIIEILDGANAIAAGDVDGDGDMDVIAGSEGNGVDKTIIWYENSDGLGDFGASQLIVASNSSFGRFIEARDMDGDNDLDILASSFSTDSKVFWIENIDGQGDFSTEHILPAIVNINHLTTGDIDNDGDLDVVTSSSTNQKIEWYENNDGFGNFNPGINTNDFPESPEAVFIADMDGDGDKDILATSRAEQELVWFKNLDGNGYFSDQILISNDPGLPSFAFQNNLIAVDIDGDGDMDLANMGQNRLAWYENDDGSALSFTQHILEDDIAGGTTISGSDLDGDGDIDLMVSRGNDSSTSDTFWYKNTDGNGTFVAQDIITTTEGYEQVRSSVFDLDGDGDGDLLTVNNSDRTLKMYKNLDGLGNYGPETIISEEGGQYLAAHSGDIDLDGDVDILLSQGQGIYWFQNIDGLGNYGPAITITVSSADFGETVYTADIDNDGDLDVIMARDGFNNRVAWYENLDGAGTFGAQQIISTQSSHPRAMHFGDVNADGDVDLVTGSWYDSKIIWHENLGIVRNEIRGYVRCNVTGGTCDTSSLPVSNIMVGTTDGFEQLASFTTSSGLYQLFPEEGDYETSLISQLPLYYQANPTSYSSSFTGMGNLDFVDFCIEPIGEIDDLNISIYPSQNDPRPGFNTNYLLVYNNVGTTELNGSINFEYDSAKISFLEASEAVVSQTANTLTFNFTGLNPFETRTIDLNFNVFPPPTTSIDDILVSTATINPITGDETEEDNVFTLEQTVIGSYDPNDITVLEGEEITIDETDKYLHYLIRFQNTGTASAINVRVEHILDDKLDWTTMQLESLSHTGHVKVENQTDVSFIFNNINLPDSTNDEPSSHGYIAFKIKPKSNVQVGDIINGVASIYFDFNPPIITNTVNTEIIETLGIDKVSAETVRLYPNPTKDLLWINSNKSIENVKLFNNLGQLLYVSTNTNSINLSDFTPGIYIIELQFYNQADVRKKIIKL